MALGGWWRQRKGEGGKGRREKKIKKWGREKMKLGLGRLRLTLKFWGSLKFSGRIIGH